MRETRRVHTSAMGETAPLGLPRYPRYVDTYSTTWEFSTKTYSLAPHLVYFGQLVLSLRPSVRVAVIMIEDDGGSRTGVEVE